MALQGTLDTFALPDVLRLLASTKKTGRLRVSGNRGTGSVWVDDGGVTAAEATGLLQVPTPVDVLFELLRYGEGSFTFEPDSKPADPNEPGDVEPMLIEAEHQLLEWREIEAVVPSMDARVTLAPELPRPEVVVEKERWKTIVAIGGGTTVSSIARALGLGEVAVCRIVKDLVELGLGEVIVGAPSAAATPREARDLPSPAPDPEPAIDLDELAADSDTSVVPDAPVTTLETPAGVIADAPSEAAAFDIEIPGVDTPSDTAADKPVATPNGDAPAGSAELQPIASNGNGAKPVEMPDPSEADEVARQLASLSPKAARAVAAAARAETDEEREAALAEVTGEDDEPINRGLLLKFLSSVRS